MTDSNRLRPPYGSLINRDRSIAFEFAGREFSGFAGDSIASALAASDQWLLSRSFKYHRPRGILTMAAQDANTLVQVMSDPNSLADRTLIADGMHVMGQNYSGSLARDRNAFLGRFARFLPVGFYYKAFFRPRGIWEYWAKFFRKRTGLGVIDRAFVPQGYDKQYKFCDVLVVGGGAAGMSAALQAAESNAEVLLVDENPALGGALGYARFDADGKKAGLLRTELISAVLASENIEAMTNAVANGWFADNWLPVIKDKRLYKVRAAEVILCTGALEQHAIFHNNDLPGVMMASAASRLIHLYGVRPGKNAVVLTGNDQGYACALDLADAGVQVQAVVDLRNTAPLNSDVPSISGEMMSAVVDRGVTVLTSSTVYAAQSRADGNHLASVEIRDIVSRGQCATDGTSIDCDLLCMSVGFTPTYQLPCQAGATLSYDDETALFRIENLPRSLRLAGAVNGQWDVDAAIAGARRAAMLATNAAGHSSFEPGEEPVDSSLPVNFGWPMFAHPKGKEFVDFDEDLQVADIVNATRDGYEHIQLVKRYSTCGMGPSQGRHSALPAARLVADATGKSVAETGVTTSRPPFAAEQLAHCAGRSFYPARRSNMHYRHIEAGAQMLQLGNWYRPAFYGSPDDQHSAIQSEVRQVRNNVGIIDVSTLGGIDIRGPDAGEFLNRIYTFGFLKQPTGRARYALMTNEAGVVIDDGVACRITDQHFYVTATTGGVDRVFQSMLKWNAQWRLDIDVANVTSAYCGINVAGPQSREVLQRLCNGIDLSPDAFPYMGVREGNVAGIPVRLLRVGFVGELGYEIHAPQHSGEALWDALIDAGTPQGIRPFGVEAQRILRLEKGHIIIGQDTDAMSHPAEVGMAWAIDRKKPFFVGKRTIRELESRPANRALVGFEIGDTNDVVPKESHLVLQGDRIVGRVTSAAFSPTLGKAIGLAYVPPASAEVGSEIDIRVDHGVMVAAKVVGVPFYDAGNQRQEL